MLTRKPDYSGKESPYEIPPEDVVFYLPQNYDFHARCVTTGFVKIRFYKEGRVRGFVRAIGRLFRRN